MERKRDQWIKELVGELSFADEYAEGTVFGLMLDAWLRELGENDGYLRMTPDGFRMPEAEELIGAAQRAGLHQWEAYPRGEVNNMVAMAESAYEHEAIEQSELDHCGDGE